MNTLGKVLAITRVNLVRTVRDRSATFFMFVLPVIIIVALGIQFGGSQRARLGVVAPTGDPFADAIVESLDAGEAGVPFEIRSVADVGTLRSFVERGNLDGGLVIPADFAATLDGSGTATLRYVGTTESLTAGLRPAIEAAVGRQAMLVTAARAAALCAAAALVARPTSARRR